MITRGEFNYTCLFRHEKKIVRNVAVVQIQSPVRQAQEKYITAFAKEVGRSVVGPMERMEPMKNCKCMNTTKYIYHRGDLDASSSNPYGYPSFTPFQPLDNRVCEFNYYLLYISEYFNTLDTSGR